MNRLSVLLWYLRRPRLYPDLVRQVMRFNVREADTSAQARAWADARAIDVGQALQQLGVKKATSKLSEIHPKELIEADEAVSKCPVKMGGPAALEFLYDLSQAAHASKILETGVAYGWSSLAFLLHLQSVTGGRLISTDRPYPVRNNDRFVGIAVPRRLRSQWRIIRQADRDAIPKAIRWHAPFDLIHYDSDKSYGGRIWAYGNLWDALSPGGLFISDDIGDNLAFKDFSENVGVDPIIIKQPASQGVKYIGVLRRQIERGK